MKAILNRLMPGREIPPAPRSTLASETDRDAVRREIVGLALRDVLRKFGMPGTWITASPQASTTARRERGLHLHLSIREWHPELFVFLVAVERQVRARALRLDPFAAEWLTGISWKFDLVDDSPCPKLPSAEFWQAYLHRHGQAPAPAAPRPDRRSGPEPAFLPTQPMAH